MNFFKWFLKNQSGNTPAPDMTAPPATPPATPPTDGTPSSIWGNVKPAWPEGMDATLMEEKLFQPFVGPDGKINHANVLKSYANAQKTIGKDKVVVPGQNATKEDWDEFHKKAFGYSPDPKEYKLEKPKDSSVDETFLGKFKEVAHKNRIPAQTATELLTFIENASKAELDTTNKQYSEYVNQGIENMRKDYGEAFDRKISNAKRFVNEIGGEPFAKFLKEQGLQSDPSLMRVFAEAGDKLYREGRPPHGGQTDDGGLTPMEVQQKIADIRGDKNHAYNNPSHPGFNLAQKEVLDLYRRAEKISSSKPGLF